MKITIAIFLLFLGCIFKNMYSYGYGVNDAFWRVVWSIDEGTIWAPNFSEENFSKLTKGMTSEEVLSLMGKPLNMSKNCEDICFWNYTKQDSGTSDFDQRWVVFNRDHQVVEVRKSFFID
ncbi:MAG: outer membrane protein assembly factor BamE [Bdellovibrio sp.]|nr:outer membrane protein assembly factor BamE [Bdellovibrio sp.]